MSTIPKAPVSNRRAFIGRTLAGAAGATIAASVGHAALPGDLDPFALARADSDDGDTQILALFHRWLAESRVADAVPDADEEEWEASLDRRDEIEEQIIGCRGGAIGLAVKAYFHFSAARYDLGDALARNPLAPTCRIACLDLGNPMPRPVLLDLDPRQRHQVFTSGRW